MRTYVYVWSFFVWQLGCWLCSESLRGLHLRRWLAAVVELSNRSGAVQPSAAPALKQVEAVEQHCVDQSGWHNLHGLHCLEYASNEFCSAGHILPLKEWTTGKRFNNPEKHCCGTCACVHACACIFACTCACASVHAMHT